MSETAFLTLIIIATVIGTLAYGQLARTLIRTRAARFEVVAAILLTIACLIPAVIAFTDLLRVARGGSS